MEDSFNWSFTVHYSCIHTHLLANDRSSLLRSVGPFVSNYMSHCHIFLVCRSIFSAAVGAMSLISADSKREFSECDQFMVYTWI